MCIDRECFIKGHKTLPFNSIVVVTKIDTGESVTVRINDRGPFKEGRIIDLSQAANEIINCGLCEVEIIVID